MQYFTFIGLGHPDFGYKKVVYTFEDDTEYMIESRFVQELIIDKHKEEIDEVYIFATKESLERYENEIKETFDSEIIIQFIEIDRNISYDVFVSELLKYMKEKEEVILDITHCFRHIPMKLLFALKYIELTKKVKIQHLYYGLLRPDNIGVVTDFIHDYELQKVSDLLAQFDRTLMINAGDVDLVVSNKDSKIKLFLDSLRRFNKMIEYCEFDNCLSAVQKINESCNSLLREEESYSIIIPLVIKIREKFSAYIQCSNDIDRKETLIQILLDHNRKQVAITFLDQFFREEMIRCTLAPKNKKFSLQRYISLECLSSDRNDFYGDTTFYNLSQFLISNIYKLRTNTFKNRKMLDSFEFLISNKEENINNVKPVLQNNKEIINTFFDKIRNHMNHGTSINREIDKDILNMLNCVKQIGRSVS